MRHEIHRSFRAVLLIAAVVALPSAAIAQRGDRSLLDQLGQDDVSAELKLSAEQQQQLEQLRESLQDRSGIAELMRKSREVNSDEERDKLREQMRNYAATRRQEADQRLAEILSDHQMTRLQQISLQQRGLRALADESVAGSLNLTDEQKQQVAKLSEQREAALAAAAEPRTDEQREQFRAEWDRKFAAVLTDEQRQQWAEQVGPAFGGGGQPPGIIAATPGGTPTSQAMRPAEAVPEGAEVVASFRAVSQPIPVAPPDDEKLSFNFRYAPWEAVLMAFAERANLTLDLNTVPPGTFSHYDNGKYTVSEALDVINGYLLARGYILIRRDNFLVCVNIDDPIPPNLVPTVSVDELPDRGRNELMTVVFPLQGVDDVDAVAAEVEKLKGPQGKVVGITPTRSLVVTDIGANLARINQLLRNVTGGPEDLVFKEYLLQHILADDAEFLVRTLLGLTTDAVPAASSSSSAASGRSDRDREQQDRSSRFSRFGGGSGFPFGPQQQAPTTSGSSNRSASKANTIADPRTNKLLVSATASEHRIIEEALKTVDVAERSPLASDRPYGAMGDKQMSVIPLASMEPTQAAIMLQSMFLKEGDTAPTISADLIGRQLIIRATEMQTYQIKQLLLQLGEDGSGARSTANRGPVRTFSLSGRDPAELLPILERMWAAKRGSTLRVVVPGEDAESERRSQILREAGQRRQETIPDRQERPLRPDETRAPAGRNADDDDRVERRRTRFDDAFAVGADAEESLDVQSPPATVEGGSRPRSAAEPGDVTLRVVGGELILISQDEAALDELELMLENVMHAVPPRTTWSIFPLKSADATEAAAMLEQLFPDSRVSQSSSSSGGTFGALTSGISSFGSGVANLTGLSELGSGPQTLRIIPETRLNALWVAGPSYKVQEVEEMLKIIDSTGLTASLRDRVPRLIPVKHADIDDVFEIVSSVYAPEMATVGGANGDPRQALASMFGGRRGGDDDNRNAQPVEPRVTLGVDRDTSHLIVSASEAIFADIEELVQSIDVASETARRTVLVRPLVNTNASVIQNSLQSIIPKVTVSTSSSRSRPSSSSSSSSNSNSGGSAAPSGPASEEFQQRMEMFRRMREQGGFGGGDRGGSSGGDRGGSSRGGSGGGDRGGSSGRGGSDGGRGR